MVFPLDLARFSAVVGLAVLLQGSVAGQEQQGTRRSPADADLESRTAILIGRVVGPDGAPVAGAVVVTSAGGQAVTDARGAWGLEVQVSLDAVSVQVTA